MAALALMPSPVRAQGARTAATVAAISAADLRTRLYLIADDSLRGRLAGSPGDSVVTAYVAAEFARVGLAPGGEGGGYFQTVHFRVSGGGEPAVPARNVIGILRGSDPVLRERVRGDQRAQRSCRRRAACGRSRLAARHELRGGHAEARHAGSRGARVGRARARLAARAPTSSARLDLQRRRRRRFRHRRHCSRSRRRWRLRRTRPGARSCSSRTRRRRRDCTAPRGSRTIRRCRSTPSSRSSTWTW